MKLSIVILLFLSQSSFAQTDTSAPSGAQAPPAAPAAPSNKKNTVMDFEAEVIDGQKKAPELFLQLDSEKADLNTILYDRKNFNDFAPINTNLRPSFSDAKKPGGAGQK